MIEKVTKTAFLRGEKETITYEENEEIIPFEKAAKGDYAKYIP